MHGHHDNRILFAVELVNVGHEGDFLQKSRQARLFPIVLLILDQVGSQFIDIFQPVCHVFLFRFQGSKVLGFFQDQLYNSSKETRSSWEASIRD